MIKAIETSYKGYRFRSRLEARWAVFFDALGVRWEYEPEGFELRCGRYLPDFYLRDWHLWVEIKGGYPTKDEIAKCHWLAIGRGEAVLAVHGTPRHGSCGVLFAWDEKGLTEELSCGSFVSAGGGLALDVEPGRDLWLTSDFSSRLANTAARGKFMFPLDAYAAARGARFEFGESGAARHKGFQR